jgi:hypothetical protein
MGTRRSGVWHLGAGQPPATGVGEGKSRRQACRVDPLGTAHGQRQTSLFLRSRHRFGWPLPSWLLRAFCDWASLHVPGLDALTSTIGSPQIVKVLLYAEWGLQAINARPIGDLLAPSDNYDPGPPPGTPVISSTDQSIAPTPAVIMTVSAAREDAASLDRLIGRMARVGVKVAYLESGLLSHTAIALREAGIVVRRR